MSDGDIAKLGIEIDTQPVKAATQDLKGLGDQAGKTADQVDKIGPALGKATAPAGDLSSKLRDGAAAATAYAGPLSAIDAAAKRAGVSAAEMATRVQGASAANTALAASSGAVETAVTRAGAGFSTFERGIAGLAVAAGGALIALAKIGDEVERSKNRLAGLTGSAESGAKAYSAVQAAAKASGVEASTLQSALEKAQIGLDTFADKHVTYANTSENAAKQTAALTAAIGTVGSIMQGNLATADEEKKALDALGISFQNTGTLSVSVFRAIQAESPSTALAISRAFGYDKVSEFVKELGKAPITIDEFVQRMTQVAPTVDAAFDPSKPKNFEQAMRGVIAAWNDVLKTVAELGGGDLLTKALGAVKDQIPVEKAALEEMARDFKALGTTIADFVGGVVTDFGKLASIAVSTATTVAGAIAAIGNAAKGGGGTPGFSDPMAGNYGTGGEADSGIQLSPSGVGLDASGNDLPTFATGGSFQVGGSGGTDSQLVQFKASPWETVTVSGGTGTPSGPDTLQGDSSGSAIAAAASSVASVKQITDAIDQSNIDISKQVLTGTDNIVNALNKLIGGVAATTVNPSTGLPVSSSGTSAGGSNAARATAVGASGGGGFTVKGLNKDYAAEAAKFQKMFDDANKAAQGGGGYDPMYAAGLGRSVGGNGTSRFRSGGALDPFTGKPLASTVPVNPNYSPVSSVSAGSDYQPFGGGYDANVSAGSDYQPFSPAYYGSGDSISAGSDYQPFSPGGSIGNDPGAMNYGGGYSDSSYPQYDTMGNATGFVDDPTNNYGYFATGGKFTVGGDGGTDTTPVKFMATKGEQVIVVPNGMPAPPDGVNMPTSAASSAPASSAAPAAATTTTTKNVTINVQAGIQADSFIRSRAQIARGI